MAETATDTANQVTNAAGGRADEVNKTTDGALKTVQGLTKADTDDVTGSLKIHVKLNLEVDIRIIAKLKGDIAIGECFQFSGLCVLGRMLSLLGIA